MSLSINQSTGWLEAGNVVIGGVKVEGITAIEYSVKQDKVNRYGAGNKPYSRGRLQKNFEGGKLTLFRREIENILRSSGAQDLTDVAPFDLPHIIDDNGVLVTYVLKDVEFTEDNVSTKQGDDEMELDVPFVFSNRIRK
jgi:hypothetical protein